MTDLTCRLYLIAPSPLPENFDTILDEALEGGDVAALRLDAGEDDAASLAAIRRVAHAHGVAVLLANRPDLAAAASCDGAHLDDGRPAAGLRRVLGDLQLGIYCGGSRDQAMQAGEDGADYVAFGPYFDADEPADLELLRWWVELMELPAVAEGAITLENCPALIEAGADFLAVGDAVWTHEAGPAAAIAAFNEAILANAPRVAD